MIDNRKEVDAHIAELINCFRIAQQWRNYQLEGVIMRMIGNAAAIRIGPIEMIVKPGQVLIEEVKRPMKPEDL